LRGEEKSVIRPVTYIIPCNTIFYSCPEILSPTTGARPPGLSKSEKWSLVLAPSAPQQGQVRCSQARVRGNRITTAEIKVHGRGGEPKKNALGRGTENLVSSDGCTVKVELARRDVNVRPHQPSRRARRNASLDSI